MCCGLTNLGRADKTKKELKVCRVHELVDGNTELRMCSYCMLCSSWICDDCMPRFAKRGYAAFVEMFEKK